MRPTEMPELSGREMAELPGNQAPRIAPTGCCSVAEQASCCTVEAKKTCCGAPHTEGCGCR